MGERHVGGYELPPGRDIPGSEILRRACGTKAVREAGAHPGDEQPFELVRRPEFDRPVCGRDDRLGFTVHEPGVRGALTRPMDPHEGFEEVAIRERPRLGPEGANREGLLEGAPDGRLVRGTDPVQNKGGITGFEGEGGGGHHGPFHRVAMREGGRRNREADKQSDGNRGAAKHCDVAVRHLVLHRRTVYTSRARRERRQAVSIQPHRGPGVRLAPLTCSRM